MYHCQIPRWLTGLRPALRSKQPLHVPGNRACWHLGRSKVTTDHVLLAAAEVRSFASGAVSVSQSSKALRMDQRVLVYDKHRMTTVKSSALVFQVWQLLAACVHGCCQAFQWLGG